MFGNKNKEDNTYESALNLPGFDVDSALKRFGGSVSSYRKALRKALDHVSGIMDTINHHLQNKDLKSASVEAHTLKGLSGNIGAVSAYELAEKLETSLTLAGAPPEKELIEQIKECLSLTITTIKFDLEAAETKKRSVSKESGQPCVHCRKTIGADR